MSNTYSTRQQDVLTRYPEIPVDREASIALIHALQVDLSMLAGMLARESEPSLHREGIEGLAYVRQILNAFMPETWRH